MLHGEQFSGAAQTRLNFIGHEQNIILLTNFCHLLQVSGRWNDHATFTLNRLDENRRGIGRDRFFNRSRVPVFNGDKPRRERTEVVTIKRLGGKGHDGNRATVEIPCRRDDLRLVTRYPFDTIRPLYAPA